MMPLQTVCAGRRARTPTFRNQQIDHFTASKAHVAWAQERWPWAVSLMRRLRSLLEPDFSTNIHATLAIKVAGDGGADGSGLAKLALLESEPRLGSKYSPEGDGGNLLLGRVEKLHSLDEMVLSRLTLEGEDEIKTIGIVLPQLTVNCQDARFCHALVYLGGILFCQVLPSKQYLTLCRACGPRPTEDGSVKMLEGGTN